MGTSGFTFGAEVLNLSAMPASKIRPPLATFSSDPEHSGTLPAHYYYDPDIYAREREAIFFKTWQFVGFAFELAEPGDYLTADIIDQKVFVVRGKDRRLHAFYNVCMHRGHILLEGSGSKTVITCPFHAWSYDTTGALKAAGNAENVAGFRLEDFKLAEVPVDQLAGMVFVNLDPDATPLAEVAPGLEDDIRADIPSFDALKFVRSDHFEMGANWKFVFDGFECYHCPHIHPGIMGDDTWLEPSFEVVEERAFWSKHIIRGGDPEASDEADHRVPYSYSAGDVVRDLPIWFLWPNHMLAAHPGPANFKIRHVLPAGPERCHYPLHHLSVNDPPTADDVAMFDYLRDELDPQDIRATEQQRMGVKSRGYSQGRLMVDAERSWRSEHGTHYFDNLVWQAVNEG